MKGHTTVKQSEELLKLGLPPQTADMFWDATYCNGKKDGYLNKPRILDEDDTSNWEDTDALPCWSFYRLLNIILWQDYDFQFFGCPDYDIMNRLYTFLSDKLRKKTFMRFDKITY